MSGLYSSVRTRRKSRSPLPPRRSAPLQKPRPAPVMTTARTASSRAAALSAASSSPRICAFRELSDSGRLRVMVATASARSTRIAWYVGSPTWPILPAVAPPPVSRRRPGDDDGRPAVKIGTMTEWLEKSSSPVMAMFLFQFHEDHLRRTPDRAPAGTLPGDEGGDHTMTRSDFEHWLERYRAAWKSDDAAHIGPLFTEDASYTSYRSASRSVDETRSSRGGYRMAIPRTTGDSIWSVSSSTGRSVWSRASPPTRGRRETSPTRSSPTSG